ncbi:MAG: glycosyltransferase family 39 protein [archaeon]
MKLQKDERRILAVLVLVSLALKLSLMSASFDDFDVTYFAHALDKFDPAHNYPHFPHYVTYIAVAKLFFLFTDSHRLALILPNAALGSLALVPMYYVSRKFLGKRDSFIATALLLLNPLFWLKSEIAMSDVTAAFFLLTGLAFLLYWERERNLVLASFFSAMALGARQTFGFFIILPLCVLKRKKELLKFIALTAAFCLVWYVPLSVSLGGFGVYPAKVFGPNPAAMRESVFAENPPYSLPMRAGLFLYSFMYTNGINPLNLDITGFLLQNPQYEAVSVGQVLPFLSVGIGLVGFVIAAFFLFSFKDFKNKWLPLLWFVPFWIVLFMFQTPNVTKYHLPIIPALCLIIAAGFSQAERKYGRVALYLLILLGGVWFVRGFDLSYTLHSEYPPPVQQIEYLRENFDTANITVIGYTDSHHYEWFAPEINYIEPDYKGQGGVDQSQITGKLFVNQRAALYLGIPVKNCKEFTRDPMAHFMHTPEVLCEAYEG